MSKVMYEYLFGDEPLFPTYMQLQMVDQSILFPEGIAKDVIVRIHDHYALLTSRFCTWVKKKMIHPSSLEDHFSTLPMQSSTSDLDKSTSNSLEKRYVAISIVIPLMNSRRSPALGGDVNHPNAKGINSPRMNGRKMKNLRKDKPTLPKSSPHTKQVWK
jgi:hypothetical protein